MYYRGTIEDFNLWHDQVAIFEGLPRVGLVNGVPAPDRQMTVAYIEAIQNPNGNNDYIWEFGKYNISDFNIVEDYNSFNWSD